MMKQFGSSFNKTNTFNNACGDVKRSNTVHFSEQVCTITNYFDKWNECERTVVLYALIKRLHYSSLRFLQNSIDSTLSHKKDILFNRNMVVLDINANNLSYLQNLFNAYKTAEDLIGTIPTMDMLYTSTTTNDTTPHNHSNNRSAYYGERKLIMNRKHEILTEVLNMLPLLRPGNSEAKIIYLAFIPIAVKDSIQLFVSPELVKQMFSYLLIHPAVSSEDRRSVNFWLRHLEDHMNTADYSQTSNPKSFIAQLEKVKVHSVNTLGIDNSATTTSFLECSSYYNSPFTAFETEQMNRSCIPNLNETFCKTTQVCKINSDWQTIAPPHKHNSLKKCVLDGYKLNPLELDAGHVALNGESNPDTIDTICNSSTKITNGITSKDNSLGLLLLDVDAKNPISVGDESISLKKISMKPDVFNESSNNAINIEVSSIYNSSFNGDQDSSFSKNGIEIMDFKPDVTLNDCSCICQSKVNRLNVSLQQPQQYYSPNSEKEIKTSVKPSHFDVNGWKALDGKLNMKTRRSNSLTTQTLLSSFSANYYVNSANENSSDSIENLAQFANKPRSLSLSMEQRCDSVVSSNSDTRLNELKPNYMKFDTKNVGMSCLGMWLKSLRLHKYVNLFKNLTYEDMFKITENHLQSMGVTKGASHKLALCIQKLKERFNHLAKLETDLTSGHINAHEVIEELTHIVLTPMKPIEEFDNANEENVALQFLKVVFSVASTLQKDRSYFQDDESISLFLLILERLIHNEAFANHMNQLKELKSKIAEIKSSQTSKNYFLKQSINGNLNKSRLNGKLRKCESKNNDRINQRKHSNDMLNFSLSCLEHLNSHQNEYDVFQQSQNLSNQQINNFSPQHSTFKSLQFSQPQQKSHITNTFIASFAPVRFEDERNEINNRPKSFSFDSQHKSVSPEQTGVTTLLCTLNTDESSKENDAKTDQPFTLF